MQQGSDSYTRVAIWLHWLIAALIIGMMVAGIWMTGAIKEKESQAIAFQVYQLHKSFGVLIFVLSILRLVWRLTHKVPSMPEGMAGWEKLAAHVTHWLFYGLMLGLPITGWLMVSASPWGLPTLFFDTVEIPHLHALAELDQAGKVLWEGRFKDIHKLIAFGGIALIILHVAAALKHHLFERDETMTRMISFLKK